MHHIQTFSKKNMSKGSYNKNSEFDKTIGLKRHGKQSIVTQEL